MSSRGVPPFNARLLLWMPPPVGADDADAPSTDDADGAAMPTCECDVSVALNDDMILLDGHTTLHRGGANHGGGPINEEDNSISLTIPFTAVMLHARAPADCFSATGSFFCQLEEGGVTVARGPVALATVTEIRFVLPVDSPVTLQDLWGIFCQAVFDHPLGIAGGGDFDDDVAFVDEEEGAEMDGGSRKRCRSEESH